ncbi:ABC transporter permease [Dactylosporangium sp. NPDC050688]|uniref:ABC transporter permease n=1 Tax=Dactylosporangium sp. NPDC050688 TaxID=3157217 RepID=UPI0034115F77
MGAYVRRRFAGLVIVVFVASVIVFSLVRVLPGDPAVTILGQDATEEQLEAVRTSLGLDEPITTQYWLWISRAATGDFGYSYATGYPVVELIANRVPATLHLVVAGLLLATVLGVSSGIIAALNRGKLVDKVINAMNMATLGVPSFSLGLVLLMVFGLSLNWLPMSGYVSLWDDPVDAITHLILPAGTLGILIMPQLSWLVRDGMLANLEQDHVRTATSMGLPRSVIVRSNLLRNAFSPVLTLLGLTTGKLLAGAVIMESVFSWPGLGSLALRSVLSDDYPTVQAVVLLAVVTVVVVNLLTDLLHAKLDPRVMKGD